MTPQHIANAIDELRETGFLSEATLASLSADEYSFVLQRVEEAH